MNSTQDGRAHVLGELERTWHDLEARRQRLARSVAGWVGSEKVRGEIQELQHIARKQALLERRMRVLKRRQVSGGRSTSDLGGRP